MNAQLWRDPPRAGGERASDPLDAVVQALTEANADRIQRRVGAACRPLPRRDGVAIALEHLRAALFPWHHRSSEVASSGVGEAVRAALTAGLGALGREVMAAIHFECPEPHEACAICARRSDEIVRRFASRLPTVRALLETDAWAAYHGDPAAASPDEAVFCYPGILAVIHHRLAHELHELGVPLVPRMIAELAHAATGIDIHPSAQIGASFFIDHGTGVVIGETSIVGERVRLYQGVTLGARRFPLDAQGRPIKGIPRHPIVEDDVVIYASATVLGRITIGRGSSIGGNVWVTRSVPPRSHVSQARFLHDVFEDGPGT